MYDKEMLYQDAMDMLLATSRTFFIPITYLEPGLKEAVASAYLSMRAIDEIEDHPELASATKINLLREISNLLVQPFKTGKINQLFADHRSSLPEVTLCLEKWIQLSPKTILPNILKATSKMASGMADWVAKKWVIKDKNDLDNYTYYVAGLVGVLLSEVWRWYDSIETDEQLAISFGRGLQAVNIIRNREEDLARGVNFFPEGWSMDDMFDYAERNLACAEEYCQSLTHETIIKFCRIPLALAHGTLTALKEGKEKLSRADVHEIVKSVT